MAYELVVIGGGNMGAALLGGLLDSGTVTSEGVAVVEAFAERRAELERQHAGVAVLAEVPACRAAVLAVKPPDIPGVAAAAAAAGAERILSVAAGVSTETIGAAAGPGVAVLRSMPNTPALVGQGVSGLAGAAGVGAADLDWAESVLRGVGLVVRVSEEQLDAVTGLTGSGPAYVFLVAEALMDAGVLAGLPRATAEQMVAQLLVGASALLAEHGDPARLRAMVSS
ncbi:MAG: pyrroline-5-carboxylate reductase, partial [Ilumatobacter sp.]|uniref:pyrroline-5-carboxylate reductase family protein n=1 Tax=Ilumatobacter sp. TaxID=1967498 RepID=UPI0026380D80